MGKRFGLRRAKRVALPLALLVAFSCTIALVPAQASARSRTGTPSWSIEPSPQGGTSANGLTSVSCASPTFCAAVGWYVVESPSNPPYGLAEVRNGTGWAVVPIANPGTVVNFLNSVSCVSASFCMAVGDYLNAAGPYQTVTEVWNGSSWSVVASPNPDRSGDQLQGVSCVTASWCIAVGKQDSGATLIMVWNGASWSVQTSPSTPQVIDFLTGVSCISAAFCTAVGYSSSPYQTLVENWNGASWSIVPSPNTGNSDYLNGVSCASASFCTAAGYVFNGTTDQTLVEMWNGSKWSIAPSPNLGTGRNFLSGASCATASSCMAVGYSDTPAGFEQTLVEAWSGSSWLLVVSPNSGTSSQLDGGIQCMSTGSCMAVGSHQAAQIQTLVETWNGSSWVVVASPNADGANNELSAVSCAPGTSGSYCVAVGKWYTASDFRSYHMFIEASNGGAWSLVPSPTPTASLYDDKLAGVSCVSSTVCTAVGGYFVNSVDSSTLVEVWNGSSWSIVPSPNPSASNELLAVACVSTVWCMAVGDQMGTSTLAEIWTGSVWNAVPTPNGGLANNVLYGISCPSSASCQAVGSYFDGKGVGHTLAEAWNGTSWSTEATPDASQDRNFLLSVSCVSASHCVSVGESSSGVSLQTLVEAWNGRSWSIAPSPNLGPVPTTDLLNGVSCIAANHCVAAGRYVYDSFGNNQALIEAWDGATWSVVQSPSPAGPNSLNGVSCTSAGVCTAVGLFDNGLPLSQTLIEQASIGAVSPDPTSTTLSCAQSIVLAGGSTTCTATVTDIAPAAGTAPSGSVAFSSNGSGNFIPTSCVLSGTGSTSACPIVFRASFIAGTQMITATYQGDATHKGSTASKALTIPALLSFGSQFRYAEVAPGDLRPGWQAAGFQDLSFNDSAFAVGNAPFGSPFCGPSPTATNWSSTTDLLLRGQVYVPPNLASRDFVRVVIEVSGGAEIYWNGTPIGYHSDGCQAPATPFVVPVNLVSAGKNLLAVRVDESNPTYNFVDVSVVFDDGDPMPDGCPIGGTDQLAHPNPHDQFLYPAAASPSRVNLGSGPLPNGGCHGVLYIDLFISTPTLCMPVLGCGRGDGRGFDEFADASRSRVRIAIDAQLGIVSAEAEPTCLNEQDCTSALPWLTVRCDFINDYLCRKGVQSLPNATSSNWIAALSNGSSWTIDISAANSKVPFRLLGDIDDQFVIQPVGSSVGSSWPYPGFLISGHGDDFPSAHIYQEFADGGTRTYGEWLQAASPTCLGFSRGHIDDRDYSVSGAGSCPIP